MHPLDLALLPVKGLVVAALPLALVWAARGVDKLARLAAVTALRRGGDPDKSYVARLFAKGRAKIAQKLGEEAVEAAIDAVRGSRSGIAEESADLLYHLLVLWADAGVKPKDVYDVLAKREGVSGIAEKASRGKKK